MAAGIEGCADLFALARRVLDLNLEPLCCTDDDPSWAPATLQPALFITEAGLLAKLSRTHAPEAVAGHSLGEFPALVAAGAIAVEDGLRLVAARGKAMAAAGRRNPGGMAAVLGLDPDTVGEICDSTPAVWTSNLNSPKQTVISGEDRALAQAAETCRKAGAKKVVRLQVPLAAHCPLMEPAADEFSTVLDQLDVCDPAVPVFCGADGRAHRDAGEIRALLVRAITAPVLFSQAVQSMRSAGIESALEVGPGKVLKGLVRQISSGIGVTCLADDAQINDFVLKNPSSSPEIYIDKQSRRPTISATEPALGISP